MAEKKITVFEKNDPLVVGTVTRRDVNGVVGPLPLQGYVLEFYIKNDVEEADGVPEYTSAANGGITITDATLGKFTIQMLSAQLATPGEYRYHLDALTNGKRLTVAYGPFVITDI